MFLLPTFNAVLQPCAVGPAAFRAHARGHFCDSCQRVVQDFSQSENPVADLAAARAAAPDGRVCGSFRAAQVQQTPPTLTRRLKWFLVALVLVVGQGLTAQEALAQVRRAAPKPRPVHAPTKPAPRQVLVGANTPIGIIMAEPDSLRKRTSAEVMPTFRGGDNNSLVAYLAQHTAWPRGASAGDDEGRVFVSFTVGNDGRAHDATVVKGLGAALNAEAVRLVGALDGFTPAREHGRPVEISMTVPVTFRRK
ncbi:MAG: hypothetical protein JWP58_265 [Hymenobacter sp.]|nr:hypothetical protein [Hymenobacter sp.]